MSTDSLLQPQAPDSLLVIAGVIPMALLLIALRIAFIRFKHLGDVVDVSMLQRGAVIKGTQKSQVNGESKEERQPETKKIPPTIEKAQDHPRRLTIPIDTSDNFSGLARDAELSKQAEKEEQRKKGSMWIQHSSVPQQPGSKIEGAASIPAAAQDGSFRPHVSALLTNSEEEMGFVGADRGRQREELDSALLSTPLRALSGVKNTANTGAGQYYLPPGQNWNSPPSGGARSNPLGPLFSGLGRSTQQQQQYTNVHDEIATRYQLQDPKGTLGGALQGRRTPGKHMSSLDL